MYFKSFISVCWQRRSQEHSVWESSFRLGPRQCTTACNYFVQATSCWPFCSFLIVSHLYPVPLLNTEWSGSVWAFHKLHVLWPPQWQHYHQQIKYFLPFYLLQIPFMMTVSPEHPHPQEWQCLEPNAVLEDILKETPCAAFPPSCSSCPTRHLPTWKMASLLES